MSAAGAGARGLPGATILQLVTSLDEDEESRSAVEAAQALLRAGARAVIAGGNGPLVSELQAFGGEWIHMDTASANPLRVRAAARAVADYIASERVDVMHARGAVAARIAAMARGRGIGRLIVTFADDHCAPLRAERGYVRALAAADRVLAHSRYLADFIAKNGRTEPGRIDVVPLRIDVDRFDPAAVSRERASVLRRAWKVPSSERLVLVPGDLEPARGQLVLPETARILVNGGLTKTAFILAGSARANAGYAQAIHAQAEAYGVGGLIRAAGVCTDMPAAYAAADFVLLPSSVPPTFSRAAAEAQATGRPVIASGFGALREFVLAPPHAPPEARTGWFARPDDPVDFARAIVSALALEPAEMRAISLRARAHAETAFAPARIAASTLSVYTSLLEGNV